MTADERDVFSEFLLVQLNQSSPVSGFFITHALENRGGGGKVLAQSFGEISEDALIFFFE
jgi:hypothetical protein